MANQNLVQENYLHMTPRTFTNNLRGLGEYGFYKKSKFEQIKMQIETEIENRQARENKCYEEAGLKGREMAGAKELSQTYFLGGNELDFGQTVYKILISPRMTEILASGFATEKDETKAFKRTLKEGARNYLDTSKKLDREVEKIINRAMQKSYSSIETLISEVLGIIIENGLMGKNINIQKDLPKIQKRTLEIISQALGAEASGEKSLYNKLAPKKGKSDTQALTSKKSQYIQTTKQAFRKNDRDVQRTIKASVNYLKQELKKLSSSRPEFTEVKIKNVCRMWEEILKTEPRLLSFNESTIQGAEDEPGIMFTQISESILNNNNLQFELFFTTEEKKDKKGRTTERTYFDMNKVSQDILRMNGQTMVDRFGAQKASKTDTYFKPSENSDTYNISQKNSYQDAFLEMRGYKNLKELEDKGKIGDITLHSSGTLLKTIFSQMEKANIFTTEEIKHLIYVITNIKVLSYFKNDGGKVTSADEDLTFSATLEGIEKAMGKGLDFFISDFLWSKEESIYKMKTIDFILIGGTLVIPVSEIFRDLLQIYTELEKQSRNLEYSVDFYISDYKQEEFQNMIDAKSNAVKDENGFQPKMNYQNQNLVNAGINAGKIAYRKLKLGDVKLNVNVSNLVQYG